MLRLRDRSRRPPAEPHTRVQIKNWTLERLGGRIPDDWKLVDEKWVPDHSNRNILRLCRVYRGMTVSGTRYYTLEVRHRVFIREVDTTQSLDDATRESIEASRARVRTLLEAAQRGR